MTSRTGPFSCASAGESTVLTWIGCARRIADVAPPWPRSALPADSEKRVEADTSAIPSPIPTRAPPPEPAADTDDEDAITVGGDDLAIVIEGAASTDPEAGRPGAKVVGKKRTADEAGLPEDADAGEKKQKKADYIVLEDDGDEVIIDLT